LSEPFIYSPKKLNAPSPQGILHLHVTGLNPAYRAFLEALGAERVWAQVLIQRHDSGFSLRHSNDRSANPATLKALTIPDLRKLAMVDAAGQFRPLRSAPDLVSRWICHCKTDEELARAIQELYPGSIPDWYSTQDAVPPTTNYREFTNRQSGMYRITQFLTDTQAAQVIAACCHARFCLKRRFWTVEGLSPDAAESKSAIPCLEPCAVLLELARKATRIEQEEKTSVQLPASDLATLVGAAKFLLETSGAGERAGNIGSPLNPRRLQLVVEKYGSAADAATDKAEESSS
jgi:hypothetical protein